MTPQQLERVDIGAMNLLCSEGLPGAESRDVAKDLAVLDEWAEKVKQETGRYLEKFRRDPSAYNNSEGYFRMLMLVTVLQQDLGVHYNMDRVREIDFRRSQDLFIHGMIGDGNGGTCVSMPVIYAAVARRLGYPVKLVLAKAHVFCRWDRPQDRFNIEATNQGMNSFDDEYYKTWPEKVSEAEVQANGYLVSLSAAEELASFLASRGHCLLDNGRTEEACEAYAAASRLAPKGPGYVAWARQAQARSAPVVTGGPQQRFGQTAVAYGDPFAEVERMAAISKANMERTVRPPTAGVPESSTPPWSSSGLPQPDQAPTPGMRGQPPVQ